MNNNIFINNSSSNNTERAYKNLINKRNNDNYQLKNIPYKTITNQPNTTVRSQRDLVIKTAQTSNRPNNFRSSYEQLQNDRNNFDRQCDKQFDKNNIQNNKREFDRKNTYITRYLNTQSSTNSSNDMANNHSDTTDHENMKKQYITNHKLNRQEIDDSKRRYQEIVASLQLNGIL